MVDLYSKLKEFPKTFENFRKWLWAEYKGNKNAFTSFFKQPFSVQYIYCLNFLEANRVPIIDALVYQQYHRPELNFTNICYFTIIFEFLKMEKGITNHNYLIF